VGLAQNPDLLLQNVRLLNGTIGTLTEPGDE
jgi:hypothetical protein